MTTITHPARPPATAVQDRVGPLDAARQILTLAWRSLVQIRHNPMAVSYTHLTLPTTERV